MRAKGVFITGTGTDVGKTFVTALLVKKFRDSGIDAFYYKAALSGTSLNPDPGVVSDEQYVKTIASLPETHETLVSYVYQEAVPTHQVKMSLFHTSKWGKRKTKCQRETPTPSLEIVF